MGTSPSASGKPLRRNGARICVSGMRAGAELKWYEGGALRGKWSAAIQFEAELMPVVDTGYEEWPGFESFNFVSRLSQEGRN